MVAQLFCFPRFVMSVSHLYEINQCFYTAEPSAMAKEIMFYLNCELGVLELD